MNNTSRIIIAISALSLLITYFVPVWRIDLFAPQYPEGLTMKIWLYTLTGDVEIINGLNHYIGMRHISVDMFPEFSFLVYVIAVYIFAGLIVACLGNLKILLSFIIVSFLGFALSLYDFYIWGYEYGHQLDPSAAIKVPGFSYQPPVIGHKRLLNFDAYSQPDIGGWVAFIAVLIMLGVWIFENYKHQIMKTKPLSFFIVSVLFLLPSCSPKPEPFKFGTDSCHVCKMGIIDSRFGSEIVTKKAKVFKFDDIGCMVRWMKSGELDLSAFQHVLVMNYEKENDLLDVNSCVFVVGEDIRSPMNFNTAGFSNKQAASEFAAKPGRKIVDWKKLYDTIE